MRPAAVGFQCPDDVAAGQRSMRTPTNPLGGPARARQPVVTWTLVALNVVAFVLEGFPVGGLPAFQQANDFVQRFSQVNLYVPDEPWRLLTSAFLHNSIIHIGLNMLILVLIGQQLEQVLGWARYLALYVVAALGGSALVYLVDSPISWGLGASGAIFGLFSAFYLVARRLRLEASGILITIGINLVLTLLIPNVSLWAHVGGLITGGVIGLIYTVLPSRPAWWQAVQIGVVLALGVVLFGVGAAGLAAST